MEAAIGAVVAGASVGAETEGCVVAVEVVEVVLAVEPKGLVRFEFRGRVAGGYGVDVEVGFGDGDSCCDCGCDCACDSDCDRWTEFSVPVGAPWLTEPRFMSREACSTALWGPYGRR